MPRTSLVPLGVCLLISVAALAQTHPSVATFTPVNEEEAAAAIRPAGTPGGAADLAYSAHCLDTNPRQGLVALTWAPGAALAGGQRIDVTKFHEGFEVGRFDASAVLEASVRTISLQDPEPGIYYYWRVLGETSDGWVASAVARFEAPICPSDGPVFDRADGGE
jgi:hypothetical protein